MATSIAAQLAQLRAQGSNPLDFKAQKIQHSQSLIFDRRVAATQDFDSLFLICHEAFRELCLLDSRFTGFANSIFSEQSKQQDRTQMTSLQNDQLNTLLDDFLGLIGGRLLLKPALKAVEWLVRRFRIQEKNTLCMVLTFLPYHTTPIFPPLLSILPKVLPPALKFLHPYVQSLANPPRHTIVYTATHNKSFFVGMNALVLEVSKSGYHYPALISFWAATITEAVAAMLDQSRSGRREIQRQSQEDVVLRIMPTLNEGMFLNKVPDLQVGCYMVLTVLVTKSALRDEVLAALMGAVASGLSQTNIAGLVCLAALAQRKESAVLSKGVLKALLKIEKLDHTFLMLKSQYNVEKLALGAVLGILEGIGGEQDTHRISLVRSMIEADLMDESSMAVAITSIISITQSGSLEQRQEYSLQSSLIDLLKCLTEKKKVLKIIQGTTGNSEEDIDVILQRAIHRDQHLLEGHEESELENIQTPSMTESFENALRQIPTGTAHEISFLSHSDSYVFKSLASAFVLGSSPSFPSGSSSLRSFYELPVLQKSLMMTEPLYLSFFIRFWCSTYPDVARAAAIDTVSECLRSPKPVKDMQTLLPYIIYGLADSSLTVRRASANLLTTLLSDHYKDQKEKKRPSQAIFGQEQIYGQARQSSEVVWLSTEEATRLVNLVLAPSLEECMLDSNHISQHLSGILNGSKTSRDAQIIHKDIKTSSRQAFFSFLCSHVLNSPILSMKFCLLKILNQIEKVGILTRTKALLPLLSESMGKSKLEYEELCNRYQISPEQFHDQLSEIVSPVDRDGIRILQSIIEAGRGSDVPWLHLAAYKRVRVIWSSLTPSLQLTLAKILLELAFEDIQRSEEEIQSAESILTLQTVSLSTIILQHFMENLSVLPDNIRESSSSSKRRRTSRGYTTISSHNDSQSFGLVLKRFAFVLELVEACNPGEHPQLLKALFQVMGELQQLKDHSNTDLGYLEVLTMGNILSIVEKLEMSSELQLDQSAIKPNMLIDCLRTTASPQVQQTALLLISNLARVTPELVLHSVMPIFTFMSATTLRQSDEYSAYVVAQTMDSVIPQLVESLHKRRDDLILGTSELLFSFVAAFEHIPSQRQLDLFKSLANKLGPIDFLFALLILLLDKYPDDQVVVQFAANLTGSYDALTQLRTVEKYLAVNLDMLKPKPTISRHLVLIGGDRVAETVIARMLPLLTVILRGERLIHKMTKALARDAENAVALRALYAQVLELIILLSSRARHDKKIGLCCSEVMDSLLDLLSTSELEGALRNILANDNNEICLQALNSFQQRLIHSSKDSQPTQNACLAFLPQLTSILEKSSSLPLKHAALACIDSISEKFGKKDIAAVLTTARVAFNSRDSSPADRSFHIAILLCLATMIEVLGDAFIPLVPLVLPQTFNHLSASIEEDPEDDSLHNATYSLIGALLLQTPWIVTGTYLERLLRISYQSANADISEDCNKSRQETLRLAARQIEPRQSFAALCESWNSAITEGPNAVMEYLETFRIIIERQPKSLILQQSVILTNILLSAFDLRRIQFSGRTEKIFDNDEVEGAESSIFESAITMIYKLNDATFRPIFLKICKWAFTPISKKDKKANIYRRTTFYTFLVKFFEALKSIVTSYAGLIIEDVVEILRDISLHDEDSKLLWRRVMMALQKAFEHDQDDFWQSPTHFSPVSDSLLRQLSHGSQISMTSEVIPVLTGLAVAADSANHHKGLNGAILQYTRSENALIRRAAVQCEYSLTERLGEEWLALLPEMLPFISELQEDDDETVEQETQRWIRKIEDILGESLKSMLQ